MPQAPARPERPTDSEALRFCVVGAGPRFFSGISVYTYRLANALGRAHPVSALLMRQLIPTRLYPGRARVGAQLAAKTYEPHVRVFDGVDWFWLPSMLKALAFLLRERPNAVVFQWWSGAVLHSYLLLALVCKLLGARLVIEFHEVLDTAEARMLPARFYVGLVAPMLLRLASAFTVHSSFDRQLLAERYDLGAKPIMVVPHGPYDQYSAAPEQPALREAPADCCNLLFFGVIRPYKGLEDLIRAFDAIPADQISQYWLTVVGETWEGWELPAELIARSRYRERITFVNRYVRDEELAGYLAGADAVVLPYHRSSMSGPLQVAMGVGLPVVATAVGGLGEAVHSYAGAILVPPADPEALRAGLARVAALRRRRFSVAHSWAQTAEGYSALFTRLRRGEAPSAPRSRASAGGANPGKGD